MKDLVITPPDGYEIDKEKSSFEHIFFKELPKRGKTWEEIMKDKEDMYCVGFDSSIEELTGITDWDLITSQNNVNTTEQAEKVIALCQLFVIMDHYNDGFDFTDQSRYYPSWNFGAKHMAFDDMRAYNQCPIYFKSFEVGREAFNNNKETFEKFFKL